jgi:predicted nucleotidyltransferase
MKTIGEVKKLLKGYKELLNVKFGVKEIGIFGSYARSEQEEQSDIDILVEFKNGYKTFDNYMDLKDFLEDLLGMGVDLVVKTALKPRLKEVILQEVVYV